MNFRQILARNESIFHFRTISLVNFNEYSPNLVCASILRGSELGLLMDKFRQFFDSYLPATHPSFSFSTII